MISSTLTTTGSINYISANADNNSLESSTNLALVSYPHQVKSKIPTSTVIFAGIIFAILGNSSVDQVGITSSISDFTPIENHYSGRSTEFFSYNNSRRDVMSFITQKDDLKKFLRSFPSLIKSIVESPEVSLSTFVDHEEGWKNLRIEIFANYSPQEISLFEDELFDLMETAEVPESVMSDIIISFV